MEKIRSENAVQNKADDKSSTGGRRKPKWFYVALFCSVGKCVSLNIKLHWISFFLLSVKKMMGHIDKLLFIFLFSFSFCRWSFIFIISILSFWFYDCERLMIFTQYLREVILSFLQLLFLHLNRILRNCSKDILLKFNFFFRTLIKRYFDCQLETRKVLLFDLKFFVFRFFCFS